MLRNNRGQIAQTINWVVATVIIVVVLLVSLFIARGMEGKLSFPPDRQKDFIATKSVVNFVDANFDVIKGSVENEDSTLLEKDVRNLLSILPTIDELSWGWVFVLKDLDKNKINNEVLDLGYTIKTYAHKINLSFGQQDNFLIEMGEKCKECTPMVNIAH